MKFARILSDDGKPEGGFPGLTAVMLSFSMALAVFAAAVMVPAGCESPAGNGYEAVSAEAAGTPALSAAGTKTIEVRFEMPGGRWLHWSEGIVATQDNSHLIYGRGNYYHDFTITITVPASDKYLNVYWRTTIVANDALLYVQAKMKAESGTITLDFNGADPYNPKPAAKNLYDVECFREYGWDDIAKYEEWWQDLYIRARSNVATKTIIVKFEVLDSKKLLIGSEGIVGTQYNSRLIYRKGRARAGYKIAIIAPAEDEYLNIYWAGNVGYSFITYVKAKMKAESGTITLDFSDYNEVAAKNLYDVVVTNIKENLHWEDLKARAASTEPAAYRTIKVKFDVRNGGYGLLNSYGMVSTEDDSYLVYDGASFADDYTIPITVPQTDEYLNIRWKGTDIWHRDTFVKAKMKAESGTITPDYNGVGKVATKNLYDVTAGTYDGSLPEGVRIGWEWEDAKKRAGK